MKIDLNKSGGDFLSFNTFLPKLKGHLLDLSVFYVLFLKNKGTNSPPILYPKDVHRIVARGIAR
jgi:hypothetical protein